MKTVIESLALVAIAIFLIPLAVTLGTILLLVCLIERLCYIVMSVFGERRTWIS